METWNSYFNLYPNCESTEKMMLHDPLVQNDAAGPIGTTSIVFGIVWLTPGVDGISMNRKLCVLPVFNG